MLRTTLFLALAALRSLVLAQQYAGDAVPNSMPNVAGAEKAFFRVPDPSGKNNHLTLLNYYTLNSTGQRRVPSEVQRVLIDVPGKNRNPQAYIGWLMTSLSGVTDPNINKDSVAIMSIMTANEMDKNVAYPFSSAGVSTSNTLVWSGTDWSQGSNNIYPTSSTDISSFAVLDAIIAYFANATMYPSLKQIVVAGHSMGGQMVERYAAVGPIPNYHIPVTFWVGNPNSYSWFLTSRPLSTTACSIFDNWKDGFANYAATMTYGTALVAKGRAAVLANLRSKAVGWAHGLLDHGDASEDCSPFPQGLDRNERFFAFLSTFRPYCNTSATCHTVDYVNYGHNDLQMLSNTASRSRFFVDNFYGGGKRAYDWTYPRQQPGDDPYPNPAMVGTPLVINQGTFSGNMKYQGCYADQAPGVFTNMVYNSNSNSVNFCTALCNADGYKIAAMQNTTQCYCGNSMSRSVAVPVIYSSCYSTCPANSSQTCGGPGRLSVYSATTPPFTA